MLRHQRHMFLLQLQLCVLTLIRVTLRRIQKPSGESPHFVSLKYTIISKGYKESQLYLRLAKIDLVALSTSVYFDTTVS